MNTTKEIKKAVKGKYSEITLTNSDESSCCGSECCSDEVENSAEETKALVKEQYSNIALKSREEGSCCGSECCTDETFTMMSEEYSALKGYNPDADLGLGCGLPTKYAKINAGDTVIDLGSGAGNDCFIARAETGSAGKVIGIDFSEPMISKARKNAEKLGYNNLEFRQGEIENLPVNDNVADVIVSNCVLNLVPDKAAAFSEIYRVLKPGGHFCISDIVLEGNLPKNIQKAGEMYAGCVSGALLKNDYLKIIKDKGFQNITVQKERDINIPDNILLKYLSKEEVEQYKNSNAGIFSITVYAEKSKIN